MQKTIPILYVTYGKYISRFRSIPYYIDCLKPVERRLLLTLFQIANKKLVKSAKVIGTCIGNYHPHGDISTYGSLVNLVQNKMAIGQGNWGSPGLYDATPAAYRYTEVRSNPEIIDLAFEYIDYVPWEELELDSEPLYLPSPIPVGLIGNGVISGVAFHSTIIPRYSKKDLFNRLKWLLENKVYEGNCTFEFYSNPVQIIKPFSDNCEINEEVDGSFLEILSSGTGKLLYTPYGEINDKDIRILGRSPLSSFSKLINAGKSGKIQGSIDDHSKKNIDIVLKPKRGTDLYDFGEELWETYLNKKININIVVCDNVGNIETIGVDQLLINSYMNWAGAVINNLTSEFDKKYQKKIELNVVYYIKTLIENMKIKSTQQIIDEFSKLNPPPVIEIEKLDRETNSWVTESVPISESIIKKVCSTRSINSLIESEINIGQIDSEIALIKNDIIDSENFCYKKMLTLT